MGKAKNDFADYGNTFLWAIAEEVQNSLDWPLRRNLYPRQYKRFSLRQSDKYNLCLNPYNIPGPGHIPGLRHNYGYRRRFAVHCIAQILRLLL